MRRTKILILVAVIAGVGGTLWTLATLRSVLAEDPDRRSEIAAFNTKFIDAHRRMDNAAVMSLWAEDGVSLLPGTAPMIGKKAIATFLEEVTARMPGYHMEKIDVDFQGIELSGDLASEWAFEHQIVKSPDGKPAFDSYGKLLLVLHREPDGNWKVIREMWNQGLKP